MTRTEEDAARLLALADARGEFAVDVDGFFYWWPGGTKGALAAWHLRTLAEELDRRNAAWSAEIERASK